VWLFFPHGVGHLVGLGVRDAGDPIPERRDEPPPFPGLRINLPLGPGFVVTVEPGLYFIPALLKDPERRRRHRDQVIWDRVDRLLGFGGIRIEDNVLITDAGPAVLTEDIPLLGGESHPAADDDHRPPVRGDRRRARRDGQRHVLSAGRPRRVGDRHRPVRAPALVRLDAR